MLRICMGFTDVPVLASKSQTYDITQGLSHRRSGPVTNNVLDQEDK